MNLIHPNLLNQSLRRAEVDARITVTEDRRAMKLNLGGVTTAEAIGELVNGVTLLATKLMVAETNEQAWKRRAYDLGYKKIDAWDEANV